MNKIVNNVANDYEFPQFEMKQGKEYTRVSVKMPMFEKGELEAIDTFTNDIVSEILKRKVKEKEMIISQRIIHNLQQRIDKAIEYCEKELNDERSLENQWLMGCYDTCKELLDILKGSDSNDNSSNNI